jgi:predicted nucleic acid-binding protein
VLVTDVNVWVRALIDESPGGVVRSRLERESQVDAPALIDLEFVGAVRGLLLRRSISRDRAEEAIGRFLDAPIQRYRHELLFWRSWQLRDNLTPYDAAYVALAETLGSTLLTLDRRIAQAAGVRCQVEVAGTTR